MKSEHDGLSVREREVWQIACAKNLADLARANELEAEVAELRGWIVHLATRHGCPDCGQSHDVWNSRVHRHGCRVAVWMEEGPAAAIAKEPSND